MLTGGYYNDGAVTVAAGGAAVTGTGTDWAGAIRAGDILWIAGVSCRIAAVTAAGALTLAYPWPGPAATAAAYEIWRQPAELTIGEQIRALVDLLGNGNAAALAGLEGAARKLPVFTGPGAMDTADLSDAGRAILGLAGAAGAKLPVVTGAGTAALRDIVGTVAQAGGVPAGALVERGSNANGRYFRFVGGLQVCTYENATFAFAVDTHTLRFNWTYPAPFVAASLPRIGCTFDRGAGSLTGSAAWVGRFAEVQTGAAAASAQIFLPRQNGAAVFAAGDSISGAMLTAIGRWHD